MSINNHSGMSDQFFKEWFPLYCRNERDFYIHNGSLCIKEKDDTFKPRGILSKIRGQGVSSFKPTPHVISQDIEKIHAIFSDKLAEMLHSFHRDGMPIIENPKLKIFEEWKEDERIIETIRKMSIQIQPEHMKVSSKWSDDKYREKSFIVMAMKYPKTAEMMAIVNKFNYRYDNSQSSDSTLILALYCGTQFKRSRHSVCQERELRKILEQSSYQSREGAIYQDYFNRRGDFFVIEKEDSRLRNIRVEVWKKFLGMHGMMHAGIIQQIECWAEDCGVSTREGRTSQEIEERNALIREVFAFMWPSIPNDTQRLHKLIGILMRVYLTQPHMFSYCYKAFSGFLDRESDFDSISFFLGLSMDRVNEMLVTASGEYCTPMTPRDYIAFIKAFLFERGPRVLLTVSTLQVIQNELIDKYPDEEIDLSAILSSPIWRQEFISSKDNLLYSLDKGNNLDQITLQLQDVFATARSYIGSNRGRENWRNLDHHTRLTPQFAKEIGDLFITTVINKDYKGSDLREALNGKKLMLRFNSGFAEIEEEETRLRAAQYVLPFVKSFSHALETLGVSFKLDNGSCPQLQSIL